MNHKTTLVVLCAQLLTIIGCASEPKDLSGQTLAPTTPDSVTLYQKKPDRYGLVGMIKIPLTPDLTWSERGHADKAFDLMKSKAAAMGANGVLFDVDRSQYDVIATAGYGTSFYQVPIALKPQRTIIARAILVTEK